MTKPKFPPRAALCVCCALIASACAVSSIHNESFVSGALNDRTGHALKPPGTDSKLPPGVSIEDGLSADEAVAVALWNNAQFQATLADLGLSRADLLEAGLLRNPIFSFLFPIGVKQLEFTLGLPLEFLWQRPNRVAEAKLNAEKVAQNLVQHGLDLCRDTLSACAELGSARAKSDYEKKEIALYDTIASNASARFKAGDISGREEAAARKLAAEGHDHAIVAERDAAIAEHRLLTYLGLPMDGPPFTLTAAAEPAAISDDPKSLLASAFAARPDLRAAELAVEAAGRRAGWEQAKIVNFTAQLDANGAGKEGFEMGPGLQLEIPIFNQNNGRIARAKAELTQASLQYLAIKDRIALEVTSARTRYAAAKDALSALRDRALSAATAEAEAARAAFKAGEIASHDLAEIEIRYWTSKILEAEAQAELLKAEAELKHGIGFKSRGK